MTSKVYIVLSCNMIYSRFSNETIVARSGPWILGSDNRKSSEVGSAIGSDKQQSPEDEVGSFDIGLW